jgi:hypothetical protein
MPQLPLTTWDLRAFSVAVLGFGTGIGISAAASHWIPNLLFGVNFSDPFILSGSLLMVLIIATAAAGVPIYRAPKSISTLNSE